jgi:5-methylthioadenosine/S-adenosylhomocysteine deaminase
MYYFEDVAAQVAHQMGLRAICGQTYLEISGVEKTSDMLKKFDSFFAEIEKYPLVQGAVAPHSIYGLSDKLWKEIVLYAEQRDIVIHTHLCETLEEVEKNLKERGTTPVKWFESIGLFERKVICAHSIELEGEDIRVLGKNRVGIVYNPESNLKLGNRICPVVELRNSGARLAFGTDSTASNNNLNLLQEADFGTKIQTLKYGVGVLKAIESVKMLTVEGARALHLGSVTGSLEVGKAADLAVLQLSQPHNIPIYDWYSHLIYSASQSDVLHTVVEGRVLMKNRQILACDEPEILARAREWGLKISKLNTSLQASQGAN